MCNKSKNAKFIEFASFFNFLVTFLCCITLTGCKDNNMSKACQVDGAKALEYVEKQVGFGRRFSGTKELKLTCDWIVAETTRLGYVPKVDVWTEPTPIGEVEFRNVKAVLPGKKPGRIIVGTHYDLKYLPEHPEGFTGANDAGSSTAVVLELMRVLKPLTDKLCTLEFHFFDGEECFENYSASDGLFGSRRVANSIAAAGKEAEYNAMVLLDMIGDKDLNFTLSMDTDTELTQLLYQQAENFGIRDKVNMNYQSLILDDHVPFQRIGIPAIDLIDFEFGEDNSYWHTGGDNIDSISAESLQTAGNLAGALILAISKEEED